jgi:hypothetical protein
MQIWMTYDEVADLLGCDAEQAYERGLEERLDCKISRDGQKRLRLNDTLADIFVDRLRAQPRPIDEAINGLRHVHGLMAGYEAQAGQPEKRATRRKFGGAW